MCFKNIKKGKEERKVGRNQAWLSLNLALLSWASAGGGAWGCATNNCQYPPQATVIANAAPERGRGGRSRGSLSGVNRPYGGLTPIR